MLGSRTDLHIFDAGSVNGTRYCNEILLLYVRLFRGAMGLQFLFMDDNAPCHRTVAAEQLLESEDIERSDENWVANSESLRSSALMECRQDSWRLSRRPYDRDGEPFSDVGQIFVHTFFSTSSKVTNAYLHQS
ncbi:transposable element Tc3 transposase [Trichonephila clavipes]|nr:transposable element Tc3 transposase [Trichonephila clavipes]